MCGAIVYGILLYLGIVGGFSLVSLVFGSAYEIGGGLGVVGLIVFFIVLCVMTSNNGDDKKK